MRNAANAPPSYYLILKTDDQNAVLEADEANNWLAVRVPVPPEALQADRLAARQIQITLTGNPGRALNLQGTPDLFHWAVLGRYTNQSRTLVITNARRRDVRLTSIAPWPSPRPARPRCRRRV